MSARTVIEHALRVYYADSRDPQHIVDTLLKRLRDDAVAEAVSLVEDRACDADWQESRDFCAGLREAVEVLNKATGGEKSIPAGAPEPVEDGATHQHPRPCEFPTVLPCRCVRPGRLPDAAFLNARKRGLIAAYFRCAEYARAAAADQRGAAA